MSNPHLPHIPHSTNPAHVANLAAAMARTTTNEKMACVLNWVQLGCMVMMGLAAGVHLVKEFARRDEGRDTRARAGASR